MTKKTLKEWEKSNLSLDKYLTEPCEIDEELSLYLGEITIPNYSGGNGLTQCGDAIKEEVAADDDEDYVYYYMTTLEVNNKCFYLGILPEFRQ